MKGVIKIIVGVICCLVFLGVIIGGAYLQYKGDERKYNNGICTQCGEELKFVNGSRSHGSTTYFYACENGHIIEVYSQYTKEN